MTSLVCCQEYGAEDLPADPPAVHPCLGNRGNWRVMSLRCGVGFPGGYDVGHVTTLRPNDHSVPAERGDEVGRSPDVNVDGAITAPWRTSMAFVFSAPNCWKGRAIFPCNAPAKSRSRGCHRPEGRRSHRHGFRFRLPTRPRSCRPGSFWLKARVKSRDPASFPKQPDDAGERRVTPFGICREENSAIEGRPC